MPAPLYYVFDPEERLHGTMCDADDVPNAVLSLQMESPRARIQVLRIEEDELCREVHTDFLVEDLGEARPAYGSRSRPSSEMEAGRNG